jgi:hypothetical protein
MENIFQVLQNLMVVDTRLCMLNGDWPFISAMLGHQGAAATFPCPICKVGKQNLLATAEYRQPGDTENIL